MYTNFGSHVTPIFISQNTLVLAIIIFYKENIIKYKSNMENLI